MSESIIEKYNVKCGKCLTFLLRPARSMTELETADTQARVVNPTAAHQARIERMNGAALCCITCSKALFLIDIRN